MFSPERQSYKSLLKPQGKLAASSFKFSPRLQQNVWNAFDKQKESSGGDQVKLDDDEKF